MFNSPNRLREIAKTPAVLLLALGLALAFAGWQASVVEARGNGGLCTSTGHRTAQGAPTGITCSTTGCPPSFTCKKQPMPGEPPRVLPNGKTGYAWACTCWRQNADGSFTMMWDYASAGVGYCDAVEWLYDTPTGPKVGDVGCGGKCPIAGQNCVGTPQANPPPPEFTCLCQ